MDLNSSTNSSSMADDDGPIISMDNLYPALVQCFGIIICGYIAGRLKIISNAETKGLNTFVGTFALPSLIFLSLVELNWQTVNWTFLLSILISKAIVFISVLVISLLVTRPLNYGRAGILATFCTQSNDFAIGYPIVMALYQHVHPEYASYLYIMAPISLAILNPIGYVLMEISNSRIRNDDADYQGVPAQVGCPEAAGQSLNNQVQRKCTLMIKTVRSILFNPILLMTVLGVIGGFAFPAGLPDIVSGVLRVFGNSFSATALFLLGLRMTGGSRKLQGSGLLTPGILILVKLLVLPLVNRQTVNILNAGANFSETTDLSTFGFLYGTFPTAPGVFVIANTYQTDVDLIATSMVACTFISGPLMFISAKMISLTGLNPVDYLKQLGQFSFDLSIASVVACFWLLFLFCITRRVTRMPHRITSCLIISQLIGSIGVLLWSVLDNQHGWTTYIQFALFTIGSYSSRLWTAILAITLLFLQCRSLCFVLKLWPIFLISAWGLPTLLTIALLLIDRTNIESSDKRNPSFQFGNAQAAISVFLLVMCFIITVGCLVLHQRYKKRIEKYLILSKEVSTESTDSEITESTTNLINPNDSEIPHLNNDDLNFGINRRIRHESLSSDVDDDKPPSCHTTDECCTTNTTTAAVIDIEDLMSSKYETTRHTNGLCSSQFNCAGTSRQSCQSLVQRYNEQNNSALEPIEFADSDLNDDDHQSMRHTVLLILLLCSMFVGLALSIWTLVMEGMSGVYVELSFLDAFLNFGQSLIVLACFITDTCTIMPVITKYFRKIWYGANILNLPEWNKLSAETKHICEQFTTHHLDRCRQTIAKDKRWRIKVYKKVFFGTTFVDWLIEVGLAKDRTEAGQYGRHLVDGRVLRHINNVYNFHDKNLLYTFCNRL